MFDKFSVFLFDCIDAATSVPYLTALAVIIVAALFYHVYRFI